MDGGINYAAQLAAGYDAYQAREIGRAVEHAETVRQGDLTALGCSAAYLLGVISTTVQLPQPEMLGYCAALARGAGHLGEYLAKVVTPGGSGEDQSTRYPVQLLWQGPPPVSPGHWDPRSRTISLDPGWVGQWIEPSPVPAGTERMAAALRKCALAISTQMSFHGTGPELSDPAVMAVTGYGAYRYRWAKAWEEGACQQAVKEWFGDLMRDVGETGEGDADLTWEPMIFELFPEEATFAALCVDLAAEQLDADRAELLRDLVREVPDTRGPVLISGLMGLHAEPTPEVSEAAKSSVENSFASIGTADTIPSSLTGLVYEIGYRPFAATTDSPPATPEEIARAEQALAYALAVATSFQEVGAILGQASSLATLRCLLAP